MADEDYLLALQLHKQWNKQVANETKNLLAVVSGKKPTTSVVDPEWEITDPNPDIHSLFGVFNVRFFGSALGAVEVKWSSRMYTCAGICTYKGKAGCVVSLSLPLLKFRPRKDLVETLLHEMIHAYLFVTKNNKDRVSHGPEFCKHMNRINKEAGTRITIYHSFHDEVTHYKTHVWRCNGKCQADPPFFGYVRRATNRAPAPNDFWFADHMSKCGGTFNKVSEPDNFKSRQSKKTKNSEVATSNSTNKKIIIDKNQKDLKNFFSSTPKSTPNKSSAKIVAVGSSEEITAVKPKQIGKPLPSAFGLNAPVHTVQAVKDQRGVVNHGGIKNNIFGFGSSSSSLGTNEKKDIVPVAALPFSGKGYVLGSGKANGLSCLLGDAATNTNRVKPSISSSSTSSIKDEQKIVYTEDLTGLDFDDDFNSPVTDLTSQDSSEDEQFSNLNCPVCNVPLKRDVTINQHLDECNLLDSVFNSSRHDTLSDSESDSDQYPTRSDISLSDDERMSIQRSSSRPSSPLVSCPSCDTKISSSSINQHLDQCLSFD